MRGGSVVRFGASERALHWGFALGFLALVATGLPLTFPELRGAIRGYTPAVGFRLHVAAAIGWLAAALGVWLLGDRARLARTWRELAAFEAGDGRWLRQFPRWLVAGPAERARIDGRVARFNAGQKVNALLTVLLSAALLATGTALLVPDPSGAWRWAHRWLTLLAVLPAAGHVFLAVAFPPTRPSLSGMLAGDVDRAWAAAHHPRWRAEEPASPEEAP
jgi:formate dehydrogenase gamma subunit